MQLKVLVKGVLSCLLILSAVSVTALAGACYGVTTVAPEVDPGMMGAALALLTGGYLVISSRRRSK